MKMSAAVAMAAVGLLGLDFADDIRRHGGVVPTAETPAEISARRERLMAAAEAKRARRQARNLRNRKG